MIPAAYTAESLAEFMVTALGDVAGVVGLASDSAEISEAIVDTLLAHGTDAVADVSGREGIVALRRLAAREAWRVAASAAAARYHFSADGGQYSRQQVHEMIQGPLARAEAAAAPYDERDPLQVTRQAIRRIDPYSPADEWGTG